MACSLDCACFGSQVDVLLQKHDLDLTESEFASLLGVCAHDVGPERAEVVLQRMGRELTVLSDSTLAAATSYFRCAALSMTPLLFQGCMQLHVVACTLSRVRAQCLSLVSSASGVCVRLPRLMLKLMLPTSWQVLAPRCHPAAAAMRRGSEAAAGVPFPPVEFECVFFRLTCRSPSVHLIACPGS